jgi:hypothetical protein
VLAALVAIPVAGSIQVIARDLLADRRRATPVAPAAPAAEPG